MANSSATAVAANVFTSPNEAFPVIRERPSVWLPVLLLVAALGAVSFVYMSSVDLPWFMEAQMQAGNAELTDEQRQEAVEQAASVSPMVYGAIGAVTSSVFVLLVLLLSALYYTGVSFLTHDGVKLKQWFALVCWCTLPIVLSSVAKIAYMLSVDSRFLMQDEINPLSFGNLFSIDRSGATLLQRILLSVDLTTVWSMVLTVLGYQAFTKSSVGKAVAIVLGPLVVIVAVGTLLSAAR